MYYRVKHSCPVVVYSLHRDQRILHKDQRILHKDQRILHKDLKTSGKGLLNTHHLVNNFPGCNKDLVHMDPWHKGLSFLEVNILF